MKNSLLLPATLGFFLLSATFVNLKKVHISEGITAKLPAEFVPMSDQDIATKYPSTKKPLAMFTSPDRLVDFGLNVTKSPWAGEDLNLLKEVYKSTLYTLYNEVSMLQEDIRQVNKNEFVVLEFTSKMDHTHNYTFLQYGIFNNRVYIFNFTCPVQFMEKWQPIAQQIMSTIKVKPGQLNAIDYKPAGESQKKGKSSREVYQEQRRRMSSKTSQTPEK